ncbi:hypothetical protein BJV85_002435 [Clostridium acetobutylicum]|uniref:Predicted membrane protein n=1 Tax=Clostridium acetobutylicum (strain ATCC 824 / DSM 792 / JCM 1419 / IAM 19013 / LMG 5710 / NBRC 13948 / NRRL B-527 / VKM B-1787 / 2291 / W) TaxID=272562 RepID=Q97IS8_CLOAB|nr:MULTISPECIES: hypothetical protein [Clostridium]AAK79529.1 Predicted membrane protein [Clostridium acetobutylicum ATCC 824]ADZ20614.1 membrane protein [Clostridium acetobutylicum EA 2018]AEI31870.1 hypothetical protein SMB_G1587 [Clostridium acetobutylicum DSM 1731]AWV81227.1 hypothetical protein DK921_14230 [Clostridium acetobutylicum]KHD36301.1 membrane protein [Clostridium acetobutylicum]
MAFNKVFRKLLVSFSVIFFITGSSTFARQTHAANIPLEDTRIAGNANTKITPSKTGDSIDVSANSDNLKKGYYSSVIYKVTDENWSNSGEFSFSIKNKSKDAMLMNFVSQLKDGTKVAVSNSGFVMLKQDGTNLVKRVRTSYGEFEIPKGFTGKVYIPLDGLEKDGDVKNKTDYDLSSVVSWALVATMQENEEKNFEVSSVGLLGKSGEIYNDGKVNFVLSGDSDVQVPVLGESISLYKATSPGLDPKTIKYKIENPIDGIRITDEGRLIISKRIKPQNISILVFINNNLAETKTVRLYNSWTLSIKGKSLPDPSTVPSLMTGFYKFILNGYTMNTIRVLFVAIAAAFGGLFMFWRKRFADNE